MKLTKYQHACFTVEDDGKCIVVDPGTMSGDFMAPANVLAIVVTHAHADHFDPDLIAAIIDKNPDAYVIAHEGVTSKIEAFETKAVKPGDKLTVGPFTLEFFGGLHAIVRKDVPVVANLGVMINDLLYYPGDSLVVPDKSVDTLAIPAAAPWMKIQEAVDFLVAVHPRFAFPTHDEIASESGKAIVDTVLSAVAKENSIEYHRLDRELEI